MQGKGELAWDTWPIRLVLKLSLQSGNETNNPLKSGPALAGPAGPATPPLVKPVIMFESMVEGSTFLDGRSDFMVNPRNVGFDR